MVGFGSHEDIVVGEELVVWGFWFKFDVVGCCEWIVSIGGEDDKELIGELMWGLVGLGELIVLDGVMGVTDDDIFVKGKEFMGLGEFLEG